MHTQILAQIIDTGSEIDISECAASHGFNYDNFYRLLRELNFRKDINFTQSDEKGVFTHFRLNPIASHLDPQIASDFAVFVSLTRDFREATACVAVKLADGKLSIDEIAEKMGIDGVNLPRTVNALRIAGIVEYRMITRGTQLLHVPVIVPGAFTAAGIKDIKIINTNINNLTRARICMIAVAQPPLRGANQPYQGLRFQRDVYCERTCELVDDEIKLCTYRFKRLHAKAPIPQPRILWSQIVHQVLYYRGKMPILKVINMIFKLIETKRWKIPYGWKYLSAVGREYIQALANRIKTHEILKKREIESQSDCNRDLSLRGVAKYASKIVSRATQAAANIVQYKNNQPEKINFEGFRLLKDRFLAGAPPGITPI